MSNLRTRNAVRTETRKHRRRVCPCEPDARPDHGAAGAASVHHVVGKDGSGYVIVLSESEVVAAANAGKATEIWASFDAHLENPPKPGGDDVVASWSN